MALNYDFQEKLSVVVLVLYGTVGIWMSDPIPRNMGLLCSYLYDLYIRCLNLFAITVLSFGKDRTKRSMITLIPLFPLA